jgi:acetyl esterase/lipase
LGDVRRLRESYGTADRQFGEWFLPNLDGAPLVVLIHGGYWRPIYRLDIEEASAKALAQSGFAVWSIDYRTYESGWPATFEDVAAAIDYGIQRAPAHGVDATRKALCGHSAGGALAQWVTSRRRLPSDAPGANAQAPLFDLIVLSAPVACLTLASTDQLGSGAVDTLMGGRPEDVPERYAVCDPAHLTPDPGRRLILHGDADTDVPMSQSECIRDHLDDHGIDVELAILPGDDHYRILDPSSTVSLLRQQALADALALAR